jgi:hypothetical protein
MSRKSFIKKIPCLTVFFLCLCFVHHTAFPNSYYDNNSNIRLAHKDLYALRLVSCEKLLRSEELKNPDNGYITFYRLYCDIVALTASNSPEEFSKKRPVLDKYIKTLRGLPDNAPEYLMLLGEAYVFTGLINVKYDNKLSGMIDCLKGFNILKDNSKRYPSFEQDDKLLGIAEIGVAFMPKALQWGAKLFNIESNPQAGLKKLAIFSEFAKGKPGYEEEAFLLTMAAFRLMNQEDAAMKLIKEKMHDFKESAILNLFCATVSVQANDAETALDLLSNIKPEKLEIDFPLVQYMKGITKLMRLDQDSDIPLQTYLKVSSGNDYIKTILYDLACFYYISGDTTKYLEYIEQVKEKGREFLSRDIEASFEAGKHGFPNIYLMRADFLVRGGYILRAENEMSFITGINTLTDDEKSLFYFLRGECFRQRNLVSQAESEYLNSFLTGKGSGSYIAQRALVNSGMMMEKNSLKKEAEKYYNSTIHYKATNNPYSYLYKNKAKAGLTRLSLSE